MRIAYADPPYPGMSGFYKDHPDFDGEVDHGELLRRLDDDFDAWILHTASTTLEMLIEHLPSEYRIGAWCKNFASWKKGVYPAYAWEPVLFGGGRNVFGECQTVPDFIVEPITLQRGLTGAKPERVCLWAFALVGARADDDLVDLFPGSGAVTRAWERFQREPQLPFPLANTTEPMEPAA